ncbi:hypothetical protein Hanom_Chr05g00409251 [Helianthus anomalus]
MSSLVRVKSSSGGKMAVRSVREKAHTPIRDAMVVQTSFIAVVCGGVEDDEREVMW